MSTLSYGPPSAPGPLSPQQLRELADARTAHKYIRRAVNVALFDGWTVAVFAIINCICGLGDFQSMLVGAVLGVIGFVEIRGASQLRRLDQTAPPRLAINQILLRLPLRAYAARRIFASLRAPAPRA